MGMIQQPESSSVRMAISVATRGGSSGSYTSTKPAGWYVIPDDNKWFAHLVRAEHHCRYAERVEPEVSECAGSTKEQLHAMREAMGSV
jgi:hypothetical protein